MTAEKLVLRAVGWGAPGSAIQVVSVMPTHEFRCSTCHTFETTMRSVAWWLQWVIKEPVELCFEGFFEEERDSFEAEVWGDLARRLPPETLARVARRARAVIHLPAVRARLCGRDDRPKRPDKLRRWTAAEQARLHRRFRHMDLLDVFDAQAEAANLLHPREPRP